MSKNLRVWDIHKLRSVPNDVLFVKSPQAVTMEQAALIKQVIRRELRSPLQPIIVLGSGVEIERLHRTAQRRNRRVAGLRKLPA